MTTKLTKSIETMRSYIGADEVLRKKFEEIAQQVVQKHAETIELQVPIGRFETITTNIGNLSYGIDFEVDTYSKEDEDGNEFSSEEEYLNHVRSQADKKFQAYRVEKQEGGKFAVLDEEGDVLEDEYETAEEAKERIPELKEEHIEEAESFDNLETIYDEVHWDIVYQYNREVNVELAKELGLGVLTILTGEHKNKQFLFLRGYGMNLSPKFIAYQAIEYGCVEEEDVYRFGSPSKRSDFRHVVGQSMYERVLQVLGIYDIVQKSA